MLEIVLGLVSTENNSHSLFPSIFTGTVVAECNNFQPYIKPASPSVLGSSKFDVNPRRRMTPPPVIQRNTLDLIPSTSSLLFEAFFASVCVVSFGQSDN